MRDDAVSDVLQAWPEPWWSARVMGRAAGFSGAAVYRLSAAGDDFALRGWPPGSLPRERLIGLHRLLGFLFARGLQEIPVPIAGRNGETVIGQGGRWWQLEPWMPGTADFREHPTRPRLQSAMECLARVHQAAAEYRAPAESAEWFFVRDADVSPAVVERSRLLAQWRQRSPDALRAGLGQQPCLQPLRDDLLSLLEVFERKAAEIADELQTLGTERFRLHPCLRDVWGDHLLFSGDRVTGLIDWGACRSDNAAIDLARLLGSFFPDIASSAALDLPIGQPPTASGAGDWSAALEFYEMLRPLTPAEHRLLRGLDRSGVLLSGMQWWQRLVIAGNEGADRERVAARVAKTARRAERL